MTSAEAQRACAKFIRGQRELVRQCTAGCDPHAAVLVCEIALEFNSDPEGVIPRAQRLCSAEVMSKTAHVFAFDRLILARLLGEVSVDDRTVLDAIADYLVHIDRPTIVGFARGGALLLDVERATGVAHEH
ncbi:MAG TPA: hypothetical protein VK843_17020 [Planctomycetota bacterium]|nr:hypothetical protein [Planctomycetota bacterium]